MCRDETDQHEFYDFARLIEGGFVYVDKTDRLSELAKPQSDGIYYLPRPRRFGKSLMISTLKALFSGRRELFRGLKIEKTDWDWEKEVYPVIHLDMSNASASTLVDFEDKLGKMMKFVCEEFGVPYDPKVSAGANFLVLLEHLPKVARQRDAKSTGKYVQSADAALAQCREKHYADAYAADGRRVVYVGVNYDPKVRTFDAVKTETLG